MFDFYGLGHVKEDQAATTPVLSSDTLLVSIQTYSFDDEAKSLLLFVFEPSMDRDMALEMSNVIASRFTNEMISPPALPDRAHMQGLINNRSGITQQDYIFSAKGREARIQMLIVPLPTQEVSHA